MKEILIDSLGLKGARGVDTPASDQHKLHEDEEPEYLPKEQGTLYRACVARCNFLGLDRPDIQYAAKEVSRGMANPTQDDLVRLKRLARYLISHPRLVFHYPFRDPPKATRVYSDTDWAGCITTRKSTSGSVLITFVSSWLLAGCYDWRKDHK